ncbi:putative pentatricopeptide repeat-containing protein [Camellia lanceoleosa]|uniref:Pentatricopeptide repeat-containing protein n=1 Tax=Camellia lanceoleosa TaxID=1840588 RepID=A0ACC0HRK8_9ERIC|nr:putative pentatricopeptide repeat-containing protein [Camellia lanceoleosa]
MYGECGLLDYSIQVFEEIEYPTKIAWNLLVSVFAQHGLGKDAMKTFDKMLLSGIKSNAITFEGLKKLKNLSIACHSSQMLLDGVLFLGLASCRATERGKQAAEQLMRLEPEYSSAYVLLSIIYVIKRAGYVAFIDSIPLDLDNNTKEKVLHHHSERIAIAFALINTPVGKPITVKKNLTVCVDCHSAIKFMSKVVGREIIVRDNSRFHHFEDGLCFCGDYW